MRKLFFSFLIVLTTLYTAGVSWALPDWIAPALKKYPIDKYLFQVGKSPGTGEAAFERAVADAHRKIASEILRNAEVLIRSNSGELQHDIVKEHYSAVLEDYSNSRQALPAMQLKGFSVRNLSVDFSRTADTQTYALVYVERRKLKQHYAEHVSVLAAEINRLIESAKFAEGAYEIKLAVKKYLETCPLYEALKEAEIIQVGAEYKYAIDSIKAFKGLTAAATGTSSVLKMSHREVIKRVTELEPQSIVFPDDIAKEIVFQFLQQHGTTPLKCWIEPLTYEDSEMVSPFTQEFNTVLLIRLGWSTVEPMHLFQKSSPDIPSINRKDLPHRITCSFWENGDEITIRATLRDLRTGDFVATALVQFLRSQLRKPISSQPPNYDLMYENTRAFQPQHHPPAPRDQGDTMSLETLEVAVWTGKGSRLLYYTEGETMKVFGRVNQPAYLRLLYTLADGRRTLLQDNYFIDSSQVNSDVEIGEFVCTPPFGAEMLVIAARTEKFPPIKTYEENGYVFLKKQDAESAARSFRGMQRKPDESNGKQPSNPQQDEVKRLPHFQQSEAQLVLTTREK